MLPSRLAAAMTLATVLAGVTACGGSSGNSSQPPSTASSVASAAPVDSAAPKTPAAAVSEAVSPSNSGAVDSTSVGPSFINGGAALADMGNLIYVLEMVNPKIGTNKDDLISKSKALCQRVNAKASESQLEVDAAKAFTNGSWVPSADEAQAIVGTVKAYGGC